MVNAIDMVRFLSGDMPIPRREIARLDEEKEYILAYSSAINLTITPLITTAISGTVAVTHLSATVIGTSTHFTTDLSVGDTIIISAETFVVYSITDDTHLVLDSAYQGTTASGIIATAFRNFTYNNAGVVTFTSAITDTLAFAYDSVWFQDKQIENMFVYKEIDKDLTLIDTNTFKFNIPYYPIRFITVPTGATFDTDTLTFTLANVNALHFRGMVIDVYSTAATLFLLMPSYPMKIRKEFMGFNDWGDYSTISRGLQAQSDRLFKLSGI